MHSLTCSPWSAWTWIVFLLARNQMFQVVLLQRHEVLDFRLRGLLMAVIEVMYQERLEPIKMLVRHQVARGVNCHLSKWQTAFRFFFHHFTKTVNDGQFAVNATPGVMTLDIQSVLVFSSGGSSNNDIPNKMAQLAAICKIELDQESA